jgi:hypothetical protein
VGETCHAFETPRRRYRLAPLAKSCAGTHTELMTVNVLRTPSLATIVRIYTLPYQVFGDES